MIFLKNLDFGIQIIVAEKLSNFFENYTFSYVNLPISSFKDVLFECSVFFFLDSKSYKMCSCDRDFV